MRSPDQAQRGLGNMYVNGPMGIGLYMIFIVQDNGQQKACTTDNILNN